MESREQAAKHVTWFGLVLNAALMAFKAAAGLLGHSYAMLADAAHTLSDLATDIVVLISFRIAAQPVDSSHAYGHGKFETLAAVIVGLSLLGVGAGICWGSIQKIALGLGGEYPASPGLIALAAAAISIVLKEMLYRRTVRVARQIDSQALMANAWHHRSDALSSVGALLGIAGARFLGPRWHLLDPVAAVTVGALILKTASSILAGSVRDLLEVSLDEETRKEILEISGKVKGVLQPHNLRTRRIGNDVAVDLHIRVDGTISAASAHDIASKIETRLFKRFGPNTHVMIHVEPYKKEQAHKSQGKEHL